ncbi:MAG TPA: DoxX family protein [Blastocatellia bacterium]|nr:DoxX family protein [Blastocatellia bacterium]
MESDNQIVSNKSLWAGRIISGMVALFLLLDGVAKLAKPAAVVEGTLRAGYPESVLDPLGLVLIGCTLLYVIPRTSVLGAILLTGYLGGATATHVRAGDPLFSIIFPFIVGSLTWLGLFLRDKRLRAIVPLTSPQSNDKVTRTLPVRVPESANQS